MDTMENPEAGVISAPPAYNESSGTRAFPSDTTVDIRTLDGTIQASHSFNVFNVPEGAQNRKVILRDGTGGWQAFVILFELQPSSHDVRKMELRKLVLHRDDEQGRVEASAAIPPGEGVLGVVSYGGTKVQIIEHRAKASIRASQKAAAKGDSSQYYFEIGDLEWRLSTKYLHAVKGKSRAGDLELVDRDGHVVAVFLNHWSGSAEAENLGKLYITSMFSTSSNRGDGLLPLAVLSALLVVMQISYRDRDGMKGLFRDLAIGSIAACTVM